MAMAQHGAEEQQHRRRHVDGGGQVLENGEGVAQDHQAGDAVGELHELEARRRYQKLRVGRLDEHEVERAFANVLDHLSQGRLDDAVEHALENVEPGDHHQRLGPAPAGDLVALLEQHEQGHQRRRRPEERQDEVAQEVDAVLHGEQERGAHLCPEQECVALQGLHPPKAS
jgi:hypothetical protein